MHDMEGDSAGAAERTMDSDKHHNGHPLLVRVVIATYLEGAYYTHPIFVPRISPLFESEGMMFKDIYD